MDRWMDECGWKHYHKLEWNYLPRGTFNYYIVKSVFAQISCEWQRTRP
jgi:hypothetical protein